MDLKDRIISSYIAQRETQIPVNRYVHQLRCMAIDVFEKRGFPMPNDEEWKYTHLMPLLKRDYTIFAPQKTSVERKDIQPYLLDDLDSFRLVFVDGVYSSWLSETTHQDKDICVLSHALSLKKYGSVIENYYSKLIPNQEGLSALNTAFSQDGAYIYIPEGTLVEKPVQILYLSTGRGADHTLLHPRNLMILGKGAHLQIIERHHALGNHSPLSNSVTEIYANAYSHLEYFKIQNDIPQASLIDHTFVSQDHGSQCSIGTFSFGGELVRNNLHVYQRDQEVHSHLNGLSILQGESLVDHHTLMEHAHPNGQSHEIYKGIFDDKSIGVFNGKITVRKQAQKTNAFQQSNNVLLSHEATINTKPQLEIFADDVRCSHGCTVGQLNQQALFYLRSRGIPEKQARAQLLFAFSREVLEHIPIPQLKNHIHELIGKKLNVHFEFAL
ncbi:Fe-S cluster assembly protein SufD [Bacteroidetes bacterium endosymbiont of Geopemphigus sp.]|uniref:Fe-S cluster assembly protein SufD n=1 Tax=Bacteroidetes bacterium endosymbiont of Geopemphigus sp. TaxID=2047937 RepID=UPI000CD04632|nr:Fe-S cluster assembly protein SufD [Bacteroidetes bacterium endosymbiont of Geopemphigus sp.]